MSLAERGSLSFAVWREPLDVIGLAADIGGTNTRLGLVTSASLTDVTRFENDRFPNFDAVLQAYGRHVDLSSVPVAALAVAGPSTSERGVLTNRNWTISRADVSMALEGADVRLGNDLAALGLSVTELDRHHWVPISGEGNDGGTQSLVLGLGTGVNVGFVVNGHAAYTELGHAGLPGRVARILREALGAQADAFLTIEDVLSGRGFPQLFRAMGGPETSPPEIVAAAEAGDALSRAVLVLLARLAGALAMELCYTYVPQRGLYLAGSVSRQVCKPPYRDSLIEAFRADDPYRAMIDDIPLRLIEADEAALLGLARMVRDLVSGAG